MCAYSYPNRFDNKTGDYVGAVFLVLGLFVLFFTGHGGQVNPDGIGLMLAGALLWIAIDNYQKIEGAEYIVTHYSGEDAIKEAMELSKDARNNSIETWAIFGGLCFAITFFIGGFLGVSAVGLGNLANFIMIFIAHGHYKELRKALLLLQVTEKGNAQVLVKL